MLRTSELYNEPTWGETLRAYKAERVSLPWQPEQQQPVKRRTTFEQSRAERAYDPILQRYRDEARDASWQRQQSEAQAAQLNAAREKQLTYSQTFDIISHTSCLQGLEQFAGAQTQTKTRMPSTRVGYDIVSGVPFREHHWLPAEERPAEDVGTAKPRGRKKVKAADHDVDYSIVSGKYFEAHEAREQHDRQKAIETAAERFWDTHDFNPIAGTFYDEDKERRAVDDEAQRATTHGAAQQARMPKCLRYAEGALYNVLSNQVKDPALLAEAATAGNRGVKSKKATTFEKAVHEAADERVAQQETRALNRISAKRVEMERATGHDLITGQPFFGRGSKAMAPMRTKARVGVWAKLEAMETAHQAAEKALKMREARAQTAPRSVSGSGGSGGSGSGSAAPSSQRPSARHSSRAPSSRAPSSRTPSSPALSAASVRSGAPRPATERPSPARSVVPSLPLDRVKQGSRNSGRAFSPTSASSYASGPGPASAAGSGAGSGNNARASSPSLPPVAPPSAPSSHSHSRASTAASAARPPRSVAGGASRSRAGSRRSSAGAPRLPEQRASTAASSSRPSVPSVRTGGFS